MYEHITPCKKCIKKYFPDDLGVRILGNFLCTNAEGLTLCWTENGSLVVTRNLAEITGEFCFIALLW